MQNQSADFWDPKFYLENSQMQKRWAKEALDFIALEAKDIQKILDVGSGDGKITASMQTKFPHAQIHGVDKSPNMVAYAQQRFINVGITFSVGDAHELNFDQQFDLVTSFSAIHRLPQPKKAAACIFHSLRPLGFFIAAFPCNTSPNLTEAFAEVDTSETWRAHISTKERKDYQFTRDEICGWLRAAGFLVIRAKMMWKIERFSSKDYFRDALRATSSLRQTLPPEKEVEFFNDVVDAYLRRFPMDHEGFVNLYVNRIEILAIKPGLAKS